ncbi:hypothetical protein UFOVP75_192 [uncultured Caudovirales phage]|uniref:Uncharacterized protein n=1 Tax=uncultured Caudovirales phage TaxID=2100421 RepID=A0A6J5L6A8_9CAUD|nr:hypothetical protein UFOVP75_192 [uncultured Caudovirales phage]
MNYEIDQQHLTCGCLFGRVTGDGSAWELVRPCDKHPKEFPIRPTTIDNDSLVFALTLHNSHPLRTTFPENTYLVIMGDETSNIKEEEALSYKELLESGNAGESRTYVVFTNAPHSIVTNAEIATMRRMKEKK